MLRRMMLALVALMAVCGYSASAQTPDVGQKAPAFTLATPDGKSIGLADVNKKGTVVLVVLRGYPGYQCPYCVRQVHDFIENADKFAEAGADVFIVYPGPSADLDVHAREALAKQNPLPANIQLVIDPDYKFTNQYGLRWDAKGETAYPSTFLIDRKGVIVFRKISKEHGDRTKASDLIAELNKAKG